MRGKDTVTISKKEYDRLKRIESDYYKYQADNKILITAVQNGYQSGMFSNKEISDGELAKRLGIPKSTLKEKLLEMGKIKCINGVWKSTSVYVRITPKGTSIKLDTPICMVLGKEYNRTLLPNEVLSYCTLFNSDINNKFLLEEVNK